MFTLSSLTPESLSHVFNTFCMFMSLSVFPGSFSVKYSESAVFRSSLFSVLQFMSCKSCMFFDSSSQCFVFSCDIYVWLMFWFWPLVCVLAHYPSALRFCPVIFLISWLANPCILTLISACPNKSPHFYHIVHLGPHSLFTPLPARNRNLSLYAKSSKE